MQVAKNLFTKASEMRYIIFATLCCLCITTDYAVVRPASVSHFISTFGSEQIPYGWLLSVPINFLIVTAYGWLLRRFENRLVMGLSVFAIVAINLLCAGFLPSTPWLSWLLFIWKDIYVLLMFQQVWSYLHTKTELSKAKLLYGIMFGIGGLGGAIGGLVSQHLAVKIGTENLLIFSAPIYVLFACSYLLMLGKEKVVLLKEESSKSQRQLFSEHRFLFYILGIVIFMQMASAFVEYQFSNALQMQIPTKDLRTAYCGKIYFYISTIKLFFQLIGTYILVTLLGLRTSHFIIPMTLLINGALLFAMPSFALVSMTFVTIKSLEYSLFNISKEMLYIPMKSGAKFKAKAFIDVFAYRSSKALASLIILGVQMAGIAPLNRVLTLFLILLLTGWIVTVFTLYRKDYIGKESTRVT